MRQRRRRLRRSHDGEQRRSADAAAQRTVRPPPSPTRCPEPRDHPPACGPRLDGTSGCGVAVALGGIAPAEAEDSGCHRAGAGAVNLLVVAALIVAAVSMTVSLVFVARRAAPDGGFLREAARGTAIFGTVGTGFAVLLAFVVLAAFQSYGRAKAGAESEAIAV